MPPSPCRSPCPIVRVMYAYAFPSYCPKTNCSITQCDISRAPPIRYNFFRTSGDIINVWDRVVENLMSVTKFLTKEGDGAAPEGRPLEPPIWFPPPPPGKWKPEQPASRPGCWAYPDMLEVGRMEGTGQTSAAMSADESASHFAAWAIVSAPLVLGYVCRKDESDDTDRQRSFHSSAHCMYSLGWWRFVCVCGGIIHTSIHTPEYIYKYTYCMLKCLAQLSPLLTSHYILLKSIRFDLQNTTRLDLAWPTISNKRAMEVSQCWEEDRADPSGAIMKVWQAETIPAVVANCGASCSSQCVNKNVNCTTWAKDNQCTENPGYMRAICPASCPATSNQTGWKLTSAGSLETPDGAALPHQHLGISRIRIEGTAPRSEPSRIGSKLPHLLIYADVRLFFFFLSITS